MMRTDVYRWVEENMTTTRPQPSSPAPASTPKRRPYSKPTVDDFGNVREITRAMAMGSVADAGGMLMMMGM